MKLLTFMPLEEIAEYEKLSGSELNRAKEKLAYEVTALIHGQEEADKAQDAAHKIFAAGGMSEDMPTTELSEGDLTDGKIAVLDLLVISKMAPSKGEARRLIQQGGVLVNDAKVEAIDATVDAAALCGDGIIVRKGKKTYRRFCIK